MEVPNRLCQPDRQSIHLIELGDGNGKTAESNLRERHRLNNPWIHPCVRASNHYKIALIS